MTPWSRLQPAVFLVLSLFFAATSGTRVAKYAYISHFDSEEV
jgi:hypothetical protein